MVGRDSGAKGVPTEIPLGELIVEVVVRSAEIPAWLSCLVSRVAKGGLGRLRVFWSDSVLRRFGPEDGYYSQHGSWTKVSHRSPTSSIVDLSIKTFFNSHDAF